MRKIVKLFLLLSVLCFFLPHTAAADSYSTNAGEKFVSGIANVATGSVELPKNMILTTHHQDLPYGMTVGLATGIMHMVWSYRDWCAGYRYISHSD